MESRMQIRSRERGQSLLETAMVIVVIFIVVFWVFELGWLMYTYTVMADAANEGVRFAVVNHDPADSDNSGIKTSTQARVKLFAKTSLHNVDAITVDVTFPNGNNSTPPNPVQVNVTYTYLPWLSGFINTPTMRTYAKGNMVR
jgi:Flp pilus assembly protein TadG